MYLRQASSKCTCQGTAYYTVKFAYMDACTALLHVPSVLLAHVSVNAVICF